MAVSWLLLEMEVDVTTDDERTGGWCWGRRLCWSFGNGSSKRQEDGGGEKGRNGQTQSVDQLNRRRTAHQHLGEAMQIKVDRFSHHQIAIKFREN